MASNFFLASSDPWNSISPFCSLIFFPWYLLYLILMSASDSMFNSCTFSTSISLQSASKKSWTKSNSVEESFCLKNMHANFWPSLFEILRLRYLGYIFSFCVLVWKFRSLRNTFPESFSLFKSTTPKNCWESVIIFGYFTSLSCLASAPSIPTSLTFSSSSDLLWSYHFGSCCGGRIKPKILALQSAEWIYSPSW